ncbi:superoxide dismutase family protein [Rubrivirga sp.]|uniref:superoxide dismutase family protein n=1 Tax=Rubrivirga sp. TaxID=1885344 RepID=UPI003C70F3FB
MRYVLLSALVLAACADAPDPEPSASAIEAPSPSRTDRAVAEIGAVDGSGVSGTVEFVDLGEAVEIRYNLAGLSPGEHGFHVHQNGDCGTDSTGTPAGAAGGHFNPLSSEHGGPGEAATDRHAGDLGNIEGDASGNAIGTRVDSVLAFSGPTSIVGKGFIVHGGRDDLESQPSGDAGPRVGCGVIAMVGEAPGAASEES